MRAPGKEREEQQDSSRLVFLSGLGGTNHEHERRDRVGNPPTSLRRYDVRNSRRVSMRYHAHALRSTRTDPDDDGTTPLQTLPTPKGGSSAPLPARRRDDPSVGIQRVFLRSVLQGKGCVVPVRDDQFHPRTSRSFSAVDSLESKRTTDGSRTKQKDEGVERTLRQTCSQPKPRAPYALGYLMVREILQFTLRIAVCCVLHRCESQDIRC